MIELVISVCLISDPANCKDVNFTYMAEAATPNQCMLHGQSEIARWQEGHPDWRISRWKCGPLRQIAKG